MARGIHDHRCPVQHEGTGAATRAVTMRRTHALAALLPPLAVALAALLPWRGGASLAWPIGPEYAAPVYSVATLRADLAREPRAWVGRTVRVRARPEICPREIEDEGMGCGSWRPTLVPPTVSDPGDFLLLVRGPGDPLLTTLRRLPALGRLLPAPQVVNWGAVAVYRVRLRVAGCDPYEPPPCYVAALLDPAPLVL